MASIGDGAGVAVGLGVGLGEGLGGGLGEGADPEGVGATVAEGRVPTARRAFWLGLRLGPMSRATMASVATRAMATAATARRRAREAVCRGPRRRDGDTGVRWYGAAGSGCWLTAEPGERA